MARMSVVVASVNGLPWLLDTLAALEAQTARAESDVVVADRTGEATRRTIAERFPNVTVVGAEPGTSIPELRRRGFEHARGEIVAFLEDHCQPAADWLAETLAGHRRLPHAVLSGVVENGAASRARDWAFFLCEYSALAPPLDEGEGGPIAGNCASYKRSALEIAGGLDGRWEGFLHQRLRAAGQSSYVSPRLRVIHRISFPFATMLAQRFHYSRSFAAMRLEGASPIRRVAYAIAALFVLPPLVLARIVRDALRKPALRAPLLRAFPGLVALAVAWGLGEAVGAIAGAGRSLGEVR